MKHTAPLLLCLFTLPLACKKSADTATPDPAMEAPAPAAEADANAEDDEDPNKAGIVIAPEIAAMCDIPTTHFEFDSSALGDDARNALSALTQCFVDGPAAGKDMRLVGHADPRGTEEYNLALGQRRAGSVAGYLTSQGLADDRVETSSRGELDAAGNDEPSWALDRKVEIFLAE